MVPRGNFSFRSRGGGGGGVPGGGVLRGGGEAWLARGEVGRDVVGTCEDELRK